MNTEETLLWEGRPSHLKDIVLYVFGVVCFWLVIPPLLALARYLQTRFTRYEVTNERLRITWGVLSTRMEETELYRVRDTAWDQPLFLRLFGLSNVVLRSTDVSTPHIVLRAIPDGRMVRENLRGAVEKMRLKKGVRTVES